MATGGLAVSDVVNVTVSLQPVASQLRNFGAMMIVGASDVIDTTERIRQYSTLGQIASDFPTTAPEYLAATLFFSQNPQPALLYIARFAQAPTSGVLHGGPLSGAQQATLLSALLSVNAGSLSVTVDGTAHALTGLNFSAVTTMSAVAAVMNAALGAYATVNWNPGYGRFNIESRSTGATSSVSYASPAGAGTDVSGMFNLTAATGASVPVLGMAAETPLACVTLLENLSNNWYGLMFAATIADADHEAVGAFIEAAAPSRVYGISTSEAGCLSSTSTTDIMSVVQAMGLSRTVVQYSSWSPYAIASWLGRAATINFQGNSTVITMMFQQEPGVVAETLTESQAAAIKSKNGNVFVNYSNGTAIIQNGTMANGDYFDEIQGTDWLQNDIQTAIYNLLFTRTTKIPQTDAGINLIANTIESRLAQAVANGLVAGGIWQGPNLGQIITGQALPSGWYLYVQPIAAQAYADRIARKAPPIQVAICLAGAVHSANVMLQVTR